MRAPVALSLAARASAASVCVTRRHGYFANNITPYDNSEQMFAESGTVAGSAVADHPQVQFIRFREMRMRVSEPERLIYQSHPTECVDRPVTMAVFAFK